ncbi:MAG: carboxypeptidase regulatory-like domain-containing protein [Promethearchaeota archaeon]|nr:MAG: carboxypeptidase regulatory-like domain-containing protein [Candidatus Lokiarchaeota archaeon]
MVDVDAQSSNKLVRVYGNVILDGNAVENANIIVKNLDQGTQESEDTNGTGEYELFIMARNKDQIRVEVSFDSFENFNEFEVFDHEVNYEINFEFVSSPVTLVVKKISDILFGHSIVTFMVYLILILFILLLMMKIGNNSNHK